MSTQPAEPIDEEWYDGRKPGSFFDRVYFTGDDSNEGHLNRVPLPRLAAPSVNATWLLSNSPNKPPVIDPLNLGCSIARVAKAGIPSS